MMHDDAMVRTQHLIWASLPSSLVTSWPMWSPRPPQLWMGLGLLSDLGLPLCAMHMFLAAKALAAAWGGRPEATVLLADTHAIEGGEAPDAVRRRAETRVLELAAIGEIMQMRFTPLLASAMSANPEFTIDLDRARVWLRRDGAAGARGAVSEYTVRAVADLLFFTRHNGIKIGWSVAPRIDVDEGQHHEPETDLIASAIDRRIAAVYVRHGVTLDSRRPKAAPYTELHDASSRLMLTGAASGGFVSKSAHPRVTPRRRRAVLQHVSLTVEAFEALVGSLPGEDILAKADALHDWIAATLAALSGGCRECIAHSRRAVAGPSA